MDILIRFHWERPTELFEFGKTTGIHCEWCNENKIEEVIKNTYDKAEAEGYNRNIIKIEILKVMEIR